eukprot:4457030-Alexandrium_andersonii.AAC.1
MPGGVRKCRFPHVFPRCHVVSVQILFVLGARVRICSVSCQVVRYGPYGPLFAASFVGIAANLLSAGQASSWNFRCVPK